MKKKYKIKGVDYKITICKLNNIDGDCDNETHEIRISDKLAGKEKFLTLLHEIVHAISHQCAWNQVISLSIEQIIAETSAQVLFDLFFKKDYSFK
jgi:Zn-dependent peptidase ImmA (M78 family)